MEPMVRYQRPDMDLREWGSHHRSEKKNSMARQSGRHSERGTRHEIKACMSTGTQREARAANLRLLAVG
jgi:hypothetical protein